MCGFQTIQPLDRAFDVVAVDVPAPTAEKISAHRPTILAALGIRESDLDVLVGLTRASNGTLYIGDDLILANLSFLARHAWLAHTLKIRIDAWRLVLALLQQDVPGFASPKAAVELGQPAMKLTLVIEGSKGSGLVQHIIRLMQTKRLTEIIEDPEVQATWGPLYQRHLKSIDIIRDRARCDDGVVFFDLIGQEVEGYNKFIPYYLFPKSTYTVSVSPSSFRTKISVGSNPWVEGD